ncbi:MAG: YesL family protein [Dorea sp.]|nr:YesL family protein [Dorea sp.]
MLMDNIIVRALSRVSDLILLNILWIICSLPVVTIGASTTALYSVMLKMAANEEGYILRGFLGGFRKNWKQSTMVWMVLLLTGAVIGADFMIVRRMPGGLGSAGMVLTGAAALIYLIEIVFVFPLIAKFENTTLHMMKNAILIPAARFPFMALVMLLIGMCIALTFLNTMTILAGAVIWCLIGVSLLAYANSFLLLGMFRPFLNREEDTVNMKKQ